MAPAGSLRVPRGIYFFLFTVSGFAGLIYESIWSHYLRLFLGHAAYAQTLVLTLFMGGMAAGSWICARYAARWRNLLAGYAFAEAAIGVAALAFHPLFVTATDWAYDTLLPAAGSPTLAMAAKWSLAGLLILPQSVLLGMTFPLMSAGLIRRYPLRPGESLAMLYFTNSFGAAIGVLASGFVMIEALGLPGTIRTAGALNLVLAAVVWSLARGGEPAQHEPSRSRATPGTTPPEVPVFLAIALLTGAASFIYEIGWIRMLSLVLGASTHSFELMLSAFILGLAAGGLWIRRRIDTIAEPARFLGVVQVAMGLLALFTLPLYGRMFDVMALVMRGLAKTDAGHAIFLLSSHGIALAIMFPATFFAGMTLPLITHALLRLGHGERSIGSVYAANTLGSILGVVLAAHVGMPLLGLKGLIAAGAALDVLVGLYLLWRLPSAGTAWPTAAACAAAFAVVLFAFPLDPYRMASGVFRRGELHDAGEAKLVSHRDGKTATVSLLDFPEGRSLRTNGKSDGAIALDPSLPRIADEVTMVLTAAIPMAILPEARSAAVIGIGTGLTTHTLLASPTIEAVDTIEIEPAMAEASRLFAPRNSNAFGDPRSNIAFDDAKTWFSTHARAGDGYDIIISEPSNPWVSGVSSLFTREFYRLVRRHLRPGGVLTQWVQLYEIDARLVASVLTALGEEFPDYVVYAATDSDLLIVAGERESLARPLADLGRVPTVAQELRMVHVLGMGDVELRRIGSKAVLAPLFATYGAPANSDYHPYLDLHAAKHRFLQSDASELLTVGSSRIPVVALLEGRSADWTRPPSLAGRSYLEKIDALAQMLQARDLVFGESDLDAAELPPGLRRDLEIIRAGPAACRKQGFELWFGARIQLARAALPLLPAVQGAVLWEHLTSGACARNADPTQKAWIELVAAVARRDAKRMGELARGLLGPALPHTEEQRRYLVTAAMAGYLAAGERGKAKEIWERHGKSLDVSRDATLRLLFGHTFPGETL